MLFCVIQTSTKGSEMLCKVCMWWIFSHWMDSASFFPESEFSVRMAACAKWMPGEPFLTPLWCLFISWNLPSHSDDEVVFYVMGIHSCLAEVLLWISVPHGIISKAHEDQVPLHQTGSSHMVPSPGTQVALSIPSWLWLMEHIDHLTPSWLCPASSPCFGFSLPTISQSKSYHPSTFNWNIISFWKFLIQIIFLYKN